MQGTEYFSWVLGHTSINECIWNNSWKAFSVGVKWPFFTPGCEYYLDIVCQQYKVLTRYCCNVVAREVLMFTGKIFLNFIEIVKMKIEFGPGTFCANLGLTFGGVGVKRIGLGSFSAVDETMKNTFPLIRL